MSDFAAHVRDHPATSDVASALAVVELSGQLDGASRSAMDQVYADATHNGASAIVLDFRRVDYINSTGIALVVGLLGRARGDNVQVRVCGLSDHYRHIFEITRLADFVTFFDDEPAAVAAPRTA